MPAPDDVLNLLLKEVKPLSNVELFLVEQTLKAPSNQILFAVENLIQSLALTLESDALHSVGPQFFLTCVSLAACHRHTHDALLLGLLEKGGKWIEAVAKDAACALVDEKSELPNSVTDTLCNCVILLSMIIPDRQFNAETILSVLEYNVHLCTIILMKAFSRITGSKPGISPLLQNDLQRFVVLRIISSIRNLCSWKIYSIISAKQLRKFKNSNGIPLNKVSGPFRHFVSLFTSSFMNHNFFEEVGVYFDVNGVNAACNYHKIVAESALLIDNLVTLTDQFTVQVRKNIFHSRIFERLFIPFLQAHNHQDFHTCSDPSVIDVLRMTATFAINSKGLQAFLLDKQEIFRMCIKNISRKEKHLWFYGCLVHLSRIIINTKFVSLLEPLVAVWNTVKPDRRHRMLIRFTEDNHFTPVDTKNPCFDRFCKLLKYEKPMIAVAEKNPRCRRRHRRRKRYVQLQQQQQDKLAHSLPDDLLSDCDSDCDDALDIQLDTDPPFAIDLTPWRKGPPPSRIPLQYICALTHRFIQSAPVISPQGCIFDQVSILSYLKDNDKCPITGEMLKPEDLLVDHDLNEKIQAIRTDFFSV